MKIGVKGPFNRSGWNGGTIEPAEDEDAAIARIVAGFGGRRRELGLSEEMMASGIGWRVAEVREVEDGKGHAALYQFYSDWLARLERLSIDRMEAQWRRSRAGQRFAP